MFTQVLDPNVVSSLPGDLGQLNELAKLANADPTPAIAGAGAAIVVGLLATPVTGAIVASYAPRSPIKGALLAVGLGLGTSLLMAALAGAGAAASVQSAQ
jgi:sulfite exporter TauE/SafE